MYLRLRLLEDLRFVHVKTLDRLLAAGLEVGDVV